MRHRWINLFTPFWLENEDFRAWNAQLLSYIDLASFGAHSETRETEEACCPFVRFLELSCTRDRMVL